MEKETSSDKRSSIPLTIENAISVVAREFILVPHALKGSMSPDGMCVTAFLEDDSLDCYEVTSIEQAMEKALNDIAGIIQGDDVLDKGCYGSGELSLDGEKMFGILIQHATLSDLKPWLVSKIREEIRNLSRADVPGFWKLWTEAGLKPIATNVRDEAYPSFSLVKDLQDHETKLDHASISDLSQSLLVLLDHDHELACDVLLDQCHFDEKKLAVALLEGMGGVAGFALGTIVTLEGFTITKK